MQWTIQGKITHRGVPRNKSRLIQVEYVERWSRIRLEAELEFFCVILRNLEVYPEGKRKCL